MNDLITVTGVVGNDPRPYVTKDGLTILNFRLASTRRVFDRQSGSWSDADTNWYTISAFRRLAENAALSIRKGEHIVVHGRLRLRAWQTAERSGTAAEIDADAIGHDLSWAVTRSMRVTKNGQHEQAGAQQAGAESADGSADRIVVDHDGTVVDHDGIVTDAAGEVFDELGLEPPSHDGFVPRDASIDLVGQADDDDLGDDVETDVMEPGDPEDVTEESDELASRPGRFGFGARR